jgi:methylase of polypeptide subunit release factors
MHEILCHLLYEYAPADSIQTGVNYTMTAAMEPGCGSGFISAGLLVHLRSLLDLVVIDTEIDAINCTVKNLSAHSKESLARKCAIYGMFDPDLFKKRFDLIVVNPPYLPFPDQHRGVESQTGAIGGTELIELLLQRGVELLKEEGALIMVYSDLARPEIEKFSAQSKLEMISLTPSQGFNVLLDLEEVAEKPDWKHFLEERGLYKDRSGAYCHSIRVTAFARQGTIDHATHGSPLARVAHFRQKES